MYIRNREEALDALSAVLELPERRDQIIQLTIKVALCLDPDARRFLADAQAGLIEGGLEQMRKKRREMLEAAPQASEEGREAIILVDSSQDQLLEAVGSAMDALRLAGIIAQVFPALSRQHASWEVGRALVGQEKSIQQAARQALKLRKSDDTQEFDSLQKQVQEQTLAARPSWFETAGDLRQAVTRAMSGAGAPSPNTSTDPDLIFNIVALDDTRAQLVLDLSKNNPAELASYIATVRARVDQLLALEAQNG